jgi:uncharacterized delta-60 repeat protein
MTSPNIFYLPTSDLALQQDGSLLISWGNEVTRYTPNGSLDTGFGTNGIVTLSGFSAPTLSGGVIGFGYGDISAPILLQPDGKILLAGIVAGSSPNSQDTVLERLNSNGTLDNTFGSGGMVIQDLDQFQPNDDQSTPLTLAVLPDGGILLGGYVFGVYYSQGFVARFHANGSLDTTFGGAGEIVLANQGDDPTPFGTSALVFNEALFRPPSYSEYNGDLVSGIFVQPDGKMLLDVGNAADSTLLRLNQNGTLDTGFAKNSDGTNGLVIASPTEFAPPNLGFDANGKILVGWIQTSQDNPPQDPSTGNHEFAVARYNSDGSTDPTFGTGAYYDDHGYTPTTGLSVFNLGEDSYVQALAVQGDGNIVLVGSTYDASKQGWDFALARVIGQPSPIHSVPGSAITLYPSGPVATQQPENFSYTWSVTKIGAAFASNSSSTPTAVPNFTFTPDTSGTYVATLTVTDQSGFTTSASNTFLVDAAPTTGGTLNQVNLPLSALVADATDQAAGFTYTINWGDGTPQQIVPRTANNGSGTTATHTYAASGSYLATITATDQYGYSQSTSDVMVIGTAGADSLNITGGTNPGDVNVTLNGTTQTFHPGDLVFASGLGGGDTYTVNFGSNLTTPIILAGGGSSSGDSLVVNGDGSSTNVINKTTGQITWGSPVTETVFRSGIANTTINANGTSANYINDPGGSTTINGGPGANFITITATTGSGVVINGGPSSNTYTVDLGNLAGPLTIQNSNTASTTTNNLVVNGAVGNNTINVAGNQVTEGTQTITDTASLANLTVNGGSGTNQMTVSALTVPVTNVTLAGGSGTNTYTVNAGSTVSIVAGTGGNILNVNGGTVAGITAPSGVTVPIVFNSRYSVLENGNLNVSASAGVLANDLSTNGHPLTAVLATGPAHGTLALNTNGSFVYTPAANFVGADSFTYQAKGSDGSLSSLATVTIQVSYKFSGFLPPLSNGLTFAVNRTIPIKFTLSDANGHAITSLSAVTSLQIQALDANGNPIGAPFNPASTNNQGLQYSGGQYQFNWQTKNLSAGSYQIVLKLADGTTQTKTIQLTAGGSSAGLVTDGSGGTTTAGALLGGEVDLYVDNTNGDLTSDELNRIQDAVTSIDATIAPYGVVINEVTDPTQANVTLNMDTTSSLGGVSQGVLGCTTNADQVTMIQGWNWYAGADPTQVGSGQYDFGTAVMHELGHVLGLGHSNVSTSVMYASLATGTANRALVTADLNVPDSDNGPCALLAAPALPGNGTSNGPGMSAPSSGSPSSGMNPLFAELAGLVSFARNAYRSELSSLSALWQQADAWAMQRLDAFWSMEAGAMGMSKDSLMRDLFFASQSAPQAV